MNISYLGGSLLSDIDKYTSQTEMSQELGLPFYYNLENILKFEGTLLFFMVIQGFFYYIFLAISLQKIARRLKISDDWHAWIPVLNLMLLLKIAKKPQSSVFLFFIPVVGLLFGVTIWMEIARILAKPKWLGALVAIPFVNAFVVLYLAFSKSSAVGDDLDIATIKGSDGAFAYDSKIIKEKKITFSDSEDDNLNQLERDLQDLQKESLKVQVEVNKETNS